MFLNVINSAELVFSSCNVERNFHRIHADVTARVISAEKMANSPAST